VDRPAKPVSWVITWDGMAQAVLIHSWGGAVSVRSPKRSPMGKEACSPWVGQNIIRHVKAIWLRGWSGWAKKGAGVMCSPLLGAGSNRLHRAGDGNPTG
jgi:hypothetical protein